MAILIVDDDSHLGKLLGLRLQVDGYETISAHTADQALEYLGIGSESPRINIDLVILDIFLPDLSGIEMCRKIKEDPDTCDIPVIMITGSSDEEHLREAFEAGAMDYIEKPFKGVEVIARIRSALKLKREIEQRKRQTQKLMEATKELQEANNRLRLMSFQDALTGLHNRRYFDEFLDKEFARAKRNRTPIAMIMIDIDYFKPYNDYFGHQAGDDCLKQIASAFAKVIHRSHDLVARYGGEEFAVVLPETGKEGALAVAEALRQSVLDLQIEHPASPFGIVTISEGVAAPIPELEDTAKLLIKAADAAMYQSKTSGRNRITAVE